MDVQGSLWLPLWIRFIVRRDWGGWLDRRMTGWAGNWIGRPNCSHNKLRKRAKERGEERVTADGWVSSPTSIHPPLPPLLLHLSCLCAHLTVASIWLLNHPLSTTTERERQTGETGENGTSASEARPRNTAKGKRRECWHVWFHSARVCVCRRMSCWGS